MADSRLSLICPGNAESRRNGCRFGCDVATVGWTAIDKGKDGDWLRINGGGHCWDTCAIEDRVGKEL
jgi:hypothetical protein